MRVRPLNVPHWLGLASLAAALAIAAPGHTEAAQPQPEGTPGTTQEQPDHGTNKAPDITTHETPGVLKPKVNPDPGISLPTPNPSKFPTPVIRPPATEPGGSTVVIPK